MTYGIDIFNAYGESLLQGGKAVYLLDQGISLNVNFGSRVAVSFEVSIGSVYLLYGFIDENNFNDKNKSANKATYWAAQSYTFVNSYSAINSTDKDYVPDTAAQTVEDIIFFEMPVSGIVHWLEYWVDHPNLNQPQKVAGIMVRSQGNETDIRYAVGSIDAIDNHGTETHGLQVFNEAGEKTFDSRSNNIIVKDFHVFSEDDIRDILENDATRTFTPRDPVTNPMVSLSVNFSLFHEAEQKFHYPNLTWDGTKFTLSRITTGQNGGNFNASIYRAFTLTVAEPEW